MLIDAGPLVALLDRGDPNHLACRSAAERLSAQPVLTTWPCWTEAMHLLGRIGGYPFQEALWAVRRSEWLQLYDLTDADANRMAELMAQYNDTPMDLADASLVALAERLGLRRVFSLDRDFHVYRLSDGSAFEVIPS